MIQDFLTSLRLLHDFQKVELVIFVPGSDRNENDVEHSYLLAMIAWHVAEMVAPHLSREKVLKYALVHDLVEVYAGDTYFYDTQSDAFRDKAAREHAAMKRILEEKMLSEDMCASLVAYEARMDSEAQFVYALDKLIPMMTIYLDGGRIWKTHGVTFENLHRLKREKIVGSPEILKLFDELVVLLEKDKQALFPE
ncbi:MAG: HD domain-containing protein [Patescibacteria group bacterium]